MITPDNWKEVVKELGQKEVQEAIDADGDYVTVEVHVSNACHWIELNSVDYSEEKETEISDNGNLYCDKDTFIQLVNETGLFPEIW